jgi:predicted Zn finger-like uncharacterized protein
MNSQEKRIVQCPFCQAQFYVWLSLLVDRRRVKCSSCGNVWFEDPFDIDDRQRLTHKDPRPSQVPSAVVPEVLQDESPEPSLTLTRVIANASSARMDPLPHFERDMRFLEEDRAPRKKYRKRFSFLVFIIPVLFFLFARDYLIRMDPSLVNIYRILGLPLKDVQEGFEIRNTAWHDVVDQGIPSIVVEGELANMSLQLKTAPSVRITTRGKVGCHPVDFASYIFGDVKAEGPDGLCVMDQWSLDVSYDRLLPGQVVPFRAIHPYDERRKVEKVQVDFVE